jgi:hypothetical protein
MARKPTDTVQLKLRFSEALRRRLERAAAREGRSMNAEIIHRLERTLAIDDSGAATNMLDFLRQLGVDVNKANERDVAIALTNAMGRAGWIFRLPDPVEEAKARKDEERKAAEARKADIARWVRVQPKDGEDR